MDNVERDYIAELRDLVAQIRKLTSSTLKAAHNETQDDERVIAISINWARESWEYAAGVSDLLDLGHDEALFPLVRAIFELDADLRYLLIEDSNERGAKCVATGLVSRIRVAEKEPTTELDEVITACNGALDKLAVEYPQVVSAAKKAASGHWSGKSRTKVIEAVMPEHGRFLYWQLSAEAHPEGVAASTAIKRTDEKMYRFGRTLDVDKQMLAMMTFATTRGMWDLLVARWGIDPFPGSAP